MAQQIPPWLQDQINQFRTTQANLQSMAEQQQHMEMERMSIERALEELQKTTVDTVMYKQAGPVLVRTAKPQLTSELGERLELYKTQASVIEKQIERLKKTYQEQESKIQAALQGGATSPTGG